MTTEALVTLLRSLHQPAETAQRLGLYALGWAAAIEAAVRLVREKGEAR